MSMTNEFPYNQEKSLLEIEQELLDSGYTEDDLNRFYPQIDNGRHGHHPECCCSQCDPYDYDDNQGAPAPSVPASIEQELLSLATSVYVEPRCATHGTDYHPDCDDCLENVCPF